MYLQINGLATKILVRVKYSSEEHCYLQDYWAISLLLCRLRYSNYLNICNKSPCFTNEKRPFRDVLTANNQLLFNKGKGFEFTSVSISKPIDAC